MLPSYFCKLIRIHAAHRNKTQNKTQEQIKIKAVGTFPCRHEQHRSAVELDPDDELAHVFCIYVIMLAPNPQISHLTLKKILLKSVCKQQYDQNTAR